MCQWKFFISNRKSNFVSQNSTWPYLLSPICRFPANRLRICRSVVDFEVTCTFFFSYFKNWTGRNLGLAYARGFSHSGHSEGSKINYILARWCTENILKRLAPRNGAPATCRLSRGVRETPSMGSAVGPLPKDLNNRPRSRWSAMMSDDHTLDAPNLNLTAVLSL